MRSLPLLVLAAMACRNPDKDVVLDSIAEDPGPTDADQDGYDEESDCDDLNRAVNPGQAEAPYNGLDDDCDPATPDDDLDGDGHFIEDDCDDGDPAVGPGAPEVCNGVDDDCDGEVDDAVGETWYTDADRDGYGDAATAVTSCDGASGLVARAGDCDDLRAEVNPDAAEVCDGLDNDCDGAVDDGVTTTWYQDADGDGHGTDQVTTEACTPPVGYAAAATDCDDGDARVNPDGVEVCDGVDDDCDGSVDEDALDATAWYTDADSDGYGDAASSALACDAPSGMVADASDCDDGRALVNPGAAEICDSLDNDCDGRVDQDATDATTWYLDYDQDGYGGSRYSVQACTAPSGFVSDTSDCDDGDAGVYPGATEICDGIDNNCDNTVDEDSAVYGDAALCAAVDCLDLVTARPSAPDGEYWIDPDAAGAFEVRCDMSTDGGGWTMVASFNNNDGAWNWTRYASGADNTANWRNQSTFGALSDYTTADYKSQAFWRVGSATDLMAVDSLGNWASYGGAVNGSLMGTIAAYSGCQTSFLGNVSVASSNSTVAGYGRFNYYGADPNNGSRCALNNSVDATDSSVISLSHQGCGTSGFGHVGYLSGSGHEDRDFKFCMGNAPVLNTTVSSCSTWFGQQAVHWFYEVPCSYALLYVR